MFPTRTPTVSVIPCATDILARGGTEQDVADILGISPAIVRKHYAKWSQARQQRIKRLFEDVYRGTIWYTIKNSM